MTSALSTASADQGPSGSLALASGSPLVLSLFPGAGLFCKAFHAEGFVVVKGPDLLWGEDVRDFHVMPGRFDGVIGGPPCQLFSQLAVMNPHAGKHGNMIPEFERVVAEASPAWFVMENVKDAPRPVVPCYVVESVLLNNRWFGEEQNRVRRFSLGTRDGRSLAPHVQFAATDNPTFEPAVLAGHGPAQGQRVRGIAGRAPDEMARLQGLPANFFADSPFTTHGKKKMLGNGVPLPMGRAIARAVRTALANIGDEPRGANTQNL